MPLPKHEMPGRRIVVVGASGAGKSAVAQRLAQTLGLIYICNDTIYWGPNWTESPLDQRLAEYDRATEAQAWTFDGNVDGLSDKGSKIIRRADTLIWLDLPRHQVFGQLLKRTIRRAWTREPMWHGNRESWRLSFFSRESILLWSMQTYTRRRKQYATLFTDPIFAHLMRVRLTSRREVDAWLASLSRVMP